MEQNLESLTSWLEQFNESTTTREERFLMMQKLCEEFGHPENQIPCFHVVGSKGKGTITHSIAQILKSQGYKVGIYTSPHVSYFTERVRSADGPFPKHIYDQAEKELKEGIEKFGKNEYVTWKSLVNIYTTLCFRIAKVDFAVYEAGLGGLNDSTNVIKPKAVAVGPIELEHTKTLGNTLEEIAREKAGTFKEGIPIFSAPQSEIVKNIFTEEAIKKHTKVEYVSGNDYLDTDVKIAISTVKSVFTNMKIDVNSVKESVRLPGRYEIIKDINNYKNIPFLLLDVAHTPSSIKAVLDRMAEEGINGNLLFGCAKDKNSEEMARIITESALFNHFYLTRPGDHKKSNLGQIEEDFKKAGVSQFVSDMDFENVILKALQDSNNSRTPLIVLGSFYLVGEVAKIISSKFEENMV